jgi:glycine dehydrogenase
MNVARNTLVDVEEGVEMEARAGFGESQFADRHIGPRESDIQEMVSYLGKKSLAEIIEAVVPASVRTSKPLHLSAFPEALSEYEALERLKEMASRNTVARSFIGMGYYDCITPPVIQRNILENPGWYTQYTPYQAEIAQGRLEALLNYQTLVMDLTGLPIANSSLLDEGTAAAEAMAMSLAVSSKAGDAASGHEFLVADTVHPQTLGVVTTRAEALGVSIKVLSLASFDFSDKTFGCLVQYPDTNGTVESLAAICEKAHAAGALVTAATDLLALCMLTPPGAMGADIVVGSAQRFGVPMGFGGPHAAFFATKDEYKRSMPGRLVGVSKDSAGRPALRLSLQTREQHIRREKATSNICTAQVLLAVMASMYAVYHGPRGLRKIAEQVHAHTAAFANLVSKGGAKVLTSSFFDTVRIAVGDKNAAKVAHEAEKKGILVRVIDDAHVGVSFDEAKGIDDLVALLSAFGVSVTRAEARASVEKAESKVPGNLVRKIDYLRHPVFNSYHSETEFLRYVRKLESRDLSLGFSMIPLGSCTMKLNATSEMLPVTWSQFGGIHPFAPAGHTHGYRMMFKELEQSLCEITGFDGCSLQPNAGSQGEYAGLVVIQAYHRSRGDSKRTVCLIPKSAHGTNPASAVMAGMEVVGVACDEFGNVDLADLEKKANEYRDRLAALMVTYPSTHGVFEEGIRKACELVHSCGGQVYMDGANLNALVGLVRPGEFGADVCHINLHKTFCIPHGGGGPGMGPICCAKHLSPFLPNHPVVEIGHAHGVGPISAAPWGSASILPISWMYMAMMGGQGLTRATEVAILSANYVSRRLEADYPTYYRGTSGFVAHECILNLQALKTQASVEVEDVAKRLMDFGFHAPTVSWPVAGTLMVEPTESESKEELDRFCDAMAMIREEVRDITAGKLDKMNNPLKNAPHTARVVTNDAWDKPYSREQAAFPATWTKENKFWPFVGRIDGVYGDRNLFCSCDALSGATTE